MSKMTLQELNETLTPERIIELVTQLGADRYIEKENYIIFPTICHNIDAAEASMKLYYYKNNKIFFCFTDCSEAFNIFGLFEKRFNLLHKEYNFYQDIVLTIAGKSVLNNFENFYETYESQYQDYDSLRPQVNITTYPNHILNAYVFSPRPEWLNDGISKETMKQFNIRYSISENKIIIPHYNINGELIGIRGRALNDEDLEFGKYMPVMIGNKLYNHPLGYNLYGLNMVKDNIKRLGFALVSESEKGVLQANTMVGLKNNICVATCGSSFHPYQFDLLQQCGAEKILIAFDKEGKTSQEQDKYFLKLKKMCNKYKYRCKMGFIWDSKNFLDLKDSPFDRGLDVLKELIKGGVWI